MEQSTPLPIVRVLDIGPASCGLVRMMEDACGRHSRLVPLLAAACLVVGCAAIPNVGTDVAMTGMPNTEIALRDSMRLVEAEMGKLGSMAPPTPALPPMRADAYPVAPNAFSNLAAPPPLLPPVRVDAYPVVPGELQKVVIFTWTGTLEDGVRQLAGNIGYVATVVLPGPRQASIPVSIATGPVPVIQAFQALGDAAGDHAIVRVDPTRRQVDVLYHA